MMNKAKEPVWHKKQKDQGIIPEGLRGIGPAGVFEQKPAVAKIP